MTHSVSSSMMIPSQVLQNHSQTSSAQQLQLANQQQQSSSSSSSSGPRRPFLSKARYKSYDGCIGGPVGPLPDLYANLDDVGMSFRSGTGVSRLKLLSILVLSWVVAFFVVVLLAISRCLEKKLFFEAIIVKFFCSFSLSLLVTSIFFSAWQSNKNTGNS